MTLEQQILNAGRQANSENPARLRTNRNVDCFCHTSRVLELLGAPWAYVGKTAGEGQYTPPGLVPFTATGRDGKPYVMTGVSHDAVTNGPLVIDLLGGGNDEPDPLGNPAYVQALFVPPQFHRPNNPPIPFPLAGAAPSPPQPPAVPTYPGDPVFDQIGVVLFADYTLAGQAPNPGMGRWIGRTVYDYLAGMSMDASLQKHRAEWRQALGLPPL